MQLEKAVGLIGSIFDEYAASMKFGFDSIAEFALAKADAFCESEIEKLFYAAFLCYIEFGLSFFDRQRVETVVRSMVRPPLNKHPLFPDTMEFFNIYVQPPIGDYRPDFVIERIEYRSGLAVFSPRVVIECDGHDFHERTKEQASRDKQKDRFCQSEGFIILRFTGSDIWRNSLRCVQEVGAFLSRNQSDPVAVTLSD